MRPATKTTSSRPHARFVSILVLAFLFASSASATDPQTETEDPPSASTPVDTDETTDSKKVETEGSHVRITTNMRDFRIDISGTTAFEIIKYGHANERRSGFEIEQLTLRLKGSIEDISWHLEGDFLGTDSRSNIYEATVSTPVAPWMRASVGQFRVALGSEYATLEENHPFGNYAFPAYLDGRYDIGARFDGVAFGEGLFYEATATIGQGFDLEGNEREDRRIGLRLVAHPARLLRGDTSSVEKSDAFDASDSHDEFAQDEPESLPDLFDGFFLGIGVAAGDDFDEPILLTNPVESTVFTTRDLNGESSRFVHVEAGTTFGPLSLAAERVIGEVEDVASGPSTSDDIDELTAYSILAAWNLTGESARYERGRFLRPHSGAPRHLAILDSFPGRLELAARYSNADIDRNLFDYGYTAYDPSTQEVRTFSVALNWYTGSTRVGLGMVRTIADHELSTFGGTNRDTSYMLRLESTF